MAAFNFPTTPALGELYPLIAVAGIPQYQWNGSEWIVPDYNPLNYVLKTGDTMTGALNVVTPPTLAAHAASKAYIDGLIVPPHAARKSNILTPHEGLVISRTSNTVVQVDAEGVVLFTATGAGKRFGTLSKALNIVNTGINGRVGFTEGPNLWYYIWAIGKADNTLETMLTAVVTPPAVPPVAPAYDWSVDYYGLLGAVRNDGSSNFVNFFQRGDHVTRVQIAALNAGAAASFTAISLIPSVPPNATIVDLLLYVYTDAASAASMSAAPEGATTIATYSVVSHGGPNLDAGYGSYGPSVQMLLTTPQQIKYYMYAGTATSIYVNGWTF